MEEMEDKDIYDTKIYTDFSVLPEETKKALFSEWLKKHPAENKLRRIYRLAPLIFAILTAAFVIASGVATLAYVFNITSIILLVCGIVTLALCVIFNERAARMQYDQSVRYAAWLKSEKNILAEIKPRKEKK